jgi:hypothetical protein
MAAEASQGVACHVCAASRTDQATSHANNSPLLRIKGYSAPETKTTAERARLLIEHAERLGEPPEEIHCCCSQLFTAFGMRTGGLWRGLRPVI